jgi:O-antigen ligase
MEVRRQPVIVATGALAGGAAVGMLGVQRGVAEALAVLVLPALAFVLLRSLWASFALVVAVVCLVPFAALPVEASVTPTFLELALLTALGLLGAVLMVDRRERLRTGGTVTLWLALLGVTTFAFLLGVGRGYTTQTLHDYARFVMGLATFWIALQIVRSPADAERVRLLLVGGTFAAASFALALYAAGPAVTLRVLTRLVPYGYPDSRIVRYIEDDPAKPMRAVGASVDPNSFGGLLMVGFVLAVSVLCERSERTARLIAAVAIPVIGAALLLTYSRGAWVGAVVGALLIVAVLRTRWLIPLALVGVTAFAAGLGGGFLNRLWQGFTLQDPATKLRLSEYRNAWAIIRRHPWFGVGFGDAPSIDLQTGVSSIYFTIAEQAGMVGLVTFAAAVGLLVWRAARVVRSDRATERGQLSLAFGAALVAALTVGLVDHYFFNPRFPHMAALFWMIGGVLAALAHPSMARQALLGADKRVSSP